MQRKDVVNKEVTSTIVHYTIVRDGQSMDGTTAIIGKYRERRAARLVKDELECDAVLIRALEYVTETYSMPLKDFMSSGSIID